MKSMNFRIMVASLLCALGARFAILQYESWDQKHYTEEICSVVGNYLEVGSLREAYEGLERSLYLHGREACVSIADNGRTFSPACIDTARSYIAFQCKTEGNEGVKAQIFYPTTAFFSLSFWVIWLGIFTAMIIAFAVLELLLNRLLESFARAIQSRLFTKSPAGQANKLMARFADWVLEKTGIQKGLRNQTEQFTLKLNEFEIRVREEAALRAKQAIEAKQSKEYLEKVRQIRHDIRSPLTGLMAVMESFEGSEIKRRALAATIKHIQRMVDDLGQIEKSQGVPELTIVEVLAEETVARLRPQFQRAKQIELSLKYNGSGLSPVMVVPASLGRVFDNLLENAFDAVQTGGKIAVSILSLKGQCEICVEDDGCGIDPSFLPRIFDKNVSTRKVNGTGLGLYHCEQSISSWGGKIHCEPLAQGTRFTIQLPLIQVAVAYVGLAGTSKVMVIDDDPSVAKALRHSGFDVQRTASNFEGGRNLLRDTHDDSTTILVDEHLGHGQLGSDLLAEDPPQKPQVFLCTNDYANFEVIERARRLGIRILPKPLVFFGSPTDTGSQFAGVQ